MYVRINLMEDLGRDHQKDFLTMLWPPAQAISAKMLIQPIPIPILNLLNEKNPASTVFVCDNVISDWR